MDKDIELLLEDDTKADFDGYGDPVGLAKKIPGKKMMRSMVSDRFS